MSKKTKNVVLEDDTELYLTPEEIPSPKVLSKKDQARVDKLTKEVKELDKQNAKFMKQSDDLNKAWTKLEDKLWALEAKISDIKFGK